MSEHSWRTWLSEGHLNQERLCPSFVDGSLISPRHGEDVVATTPSKYLLPYLGDEVKEDGPTILELDCKEVNLYQFFHPLR